MIPCCSRDDSKRWSISCFPIEQGVAILHLQACCSVELASIKAVSNDKRSVRRESELSKTPTAAIPDDFEGLLGWQLSHVRF